MCTEATLGHYDRRQDQKELRKAVEMSEIESEPYEVESYDTDQTFDQWIESIGH